MKIKESLYKKCELFIDNRLLNIQNTISELEKALFSETKSSAGDKHETGRAMIHLELEKTGQHLYEAQKIKEALLRIYTNKLSKNVSLGSVVYTSRANYYIAISAGEIEYKNELFFAISPNTPIGKILLSKQVDDSINFRGAKSLIEKVI